jgi:integrase
MTRNRYNIRKETNERGVVWRATIDLGPDPLTGKRRQRRLSATTRKALEAKIGELLGAAERGELLSDRRITVAAYLDEWLVAIEPSIRPLTVESYRGTIRTHITPHIGALQLRALTPLHVHALVSRKSRELAASTVHKIISILRAAMRRAVAWNLIPRDVTADVIAPRQGAPIDATWSSEQARLFLDAARGHDLYAFYYLAISTGMRLGELLGLRWSDIDFERRFLRVVRSVHAPNRWHVTVSDPKTPTSRRRIALADDIVRELRLHRDRQQMGRFPVGPDDPCFTNDNPHRLPLTKGRVSYHLEVICAKAGVPKIRFHDIRHTAATLMLEAGEHPKVVAERLGHSKVAMTLDRYSHVTPDMQQAAADRLADAIRPKKSTGS